jgi:hypothetical protein
MVLTENHTNISFVCHLKYPTIIKWLGWTVRVRITAGQEIFLSPKPCTLVLWPIPPPNLSVPGFFPGCKAARAGREIDHSPPPTTEVSNEGNYLYSPYKPSWCRHGKFHFTLL